MQKMNAGLNHQDFESLQSAILQLNSFRDLTAFRHALPGIMLRLIPADYFVWNEILFIEGVPNLVDFVESTEGVMQPFVERMTTVFPEHPFNASFMGNPDPTPLMFSDFYTLEEFRKTRLYQVAHDHPGGWCYQLSVPIVLHPGLISSLNFGGTQKNFSERDREALNIVRKHFKQAYQNTEAATARAMASSQPLIRFQLTAREAEIGLWLAEGKSNPEIAAILGLSPRTIEKHMEKILEKLNVENRTAAAIAIGQS
jgi:DNA-binding CsgD family transcriptional regulator